MRKLTAILLIAIMILVLGSCSGGSVADVSDTSEAAEESSADQSVAEESEYELFSNLTKTDYDDTVTFLVEGDYAGNYKSFEILAHDESPELISDAVRERNSLVEEYFGVKIAEVRTASSGELIIKARADATTGTQLYDVICPYVTHAASLAGEKLLYNLYELEDIHLDMPYWDQQAVNDLSINNKLYFCVGDANLLALACTHSITFNKKFVTDGIVEDPYTLVAEGTWTYDKLYELGKKVTADSDGESGMTSTDTYGFLVNDNFPTSMYLGSGLKLVGKDSKDMPVLQVTSKTSADIVEKLVNIINDSACSAQIETFAYDVSRRGKETVWTLATEMVAVGNCLFRADTIGNVQRQGEYDCSFGILPIPKYTETQEYYYSNVSIVLAPCFCIHIGVQGERLQMVATILDAINQASTKTSKYAYYEQLLKGRKIQDLDSEAVLDDIFDHRVYELGIVYGWGGVNTIINSVVWSGVNTFSSSLDSIKDAIQQGIDNTTTLIG